MRFRLAPFAAIVLTAFALVPAGAHLLALPNKIALPQTQYFVTQGIYRGWALLGVVLIGAIVANVVFAIQLRRTGTAFKLAASGAVVMAATLAIFFTWTYPANQATTNWLLAPSNWETLRLQWEYSHAINAVLIVLALCAETAAALIAPTPPPTLPD